jgi:hypothetical protein
MVLGIMGVLCFFPMPWCACWNPFALAAFTGILGFWADRYIRCIRS